MLKTFSPLKENRPPGPGTPTSTSKSKTTTQKLDNRFDKWRSIRVTLRDICSITGTFNGQATHIIVEYENVPLPRSLSSFGNGCYSTITYPLKATVPLRFVLRDIRETTLGIVNVDLFSIFAPGVEKLDYVAVLFSSGNEGLVLNLHLSAEASTGISIRSTVGNPAPSTPPTIIHPPPASAQQQQQHQQQYQQQQQQQQLQGGSASPRAMDAMSLTMNQLGQATTPTTSPESNNKKPHGSTNNGPPKSVNIHIKTFENVDTVGKVLHFEVLSSSRGVVARSPMCRVLEDGSCVFNHQFVLPIWRDESSFKILLYGARNQCVGNTAIFLPTTEEWLLMDQGCDVHFTTSAFGTASMSYSAILSTDEPGTWTLPPASPASDEGLMETLEPWFIKQEDDDKSGGDGKGNRLSFGSLEVPKSLRVTVKASEKSEGAAFDLTEVAVGVVLTPTHFILTPFTATGMSGITTVLGLPYDAQKSCTVVLLEKRSSEMHVVGHASVDLSSLSSKQDLQLVKLACVDLSGKWRGSVSLNFERSMTILDIPKLLDADSADDTSDASPSGPVKQLLQLVVDKISIHGMPKTFALPEEAKMAIVLVTPTGVASRDVSQTMILPAVEPISPSGVIHFEAGQEFSYNGEPQLRVSFERADFTVIAKTRVNLEKYRNGGETLIEKTFSMCGPGNESVPFQLCVSLMFLPAVPFAQLTGRSSIMTTFIAGTVLDIGACGEVAERSVVDRGPSSNGYGIVVKKLIGKLDKTRKQLPATMNLSIQSAWYGNDSISIGPLKWVLKGNEYSATMTEGNSDSPLRFAEDDGPVQISLATSTNTPLVSTQLTSAVLSAPLNAASDLLFGSGPDGLVVEMENKEYKVELHFSLSGC